MVESQNRWAQISDLQRNSMQAKSFRAVTLMQPPTEAGCPPGSSLLKPELLESYRCDDGKILKQKLRARAFIPCNSKI